MARDARTSRVDLYAAIRRDAKAGLSKRALQRKHGVGYRTVAAALESAWPKQPKPPPKRGSRLDAYRDVIASVAIASNESFSKAHMFA
jgi:hypothetical protein